MEKKNYTLADLGLLKRKISSTDDLEKELETVTEEISVLVEMTQSLIAEKARTVLDQDNFEKRYNILVDRFEEKKFRYNELTATIADKQAQSDIIGNSIKTIRKVDGII